MRVGNASIPPASWMLPSVSQSRKKIRVDISDCHKLLGRKMGKAQ
jgi:hypothetical protein